MSEPAHSLDHYKRWFTACLKHEEPEEGWFPCSPRTGLELVEYTQARDAHIAALEARIAELEPLAEVGRLLREMPLGVGIRRCRGHWDRVFWRGDLGEWQTESQHSDALRALVGEKDT